ncbi:hypothetical protein [Muricoccus radiodurans]|uniref:hypothetical protein n=1 Tax=Muricoccus radiodurans TaxID=2231721 RepID=UPI003CF374EC
MTHPIGRRGVLASGSLLLAAVAARAQTRGAVDELHGTLTRGNAATFGRFVADHVNRMVSLRVTAAQATGAGFSVDQDRDLLLVNTDQPEKLQVSVTRGYARQGASFTVDGVFTVKAEGMQQGILIYVLDPVTDAQAQEARSGEVRRSALN